jgi:hypothetical protein
VAVSSALPTSLPFETFNTAVALSAAAAGAARKRFIASTAVKVDLSTMAASP